MRREYRHSGPAADIVASAARFLAAPRLPVAAAPYAAAAIAIAAALAPGPLGSLRAETAPPRRVVVESAEAGGESRAPTSFSTIRIEAYDDRGRLILLAREKKKAGGGGVGKTEAAGERAPGPAKGADRPGLSYRRFGYDRRGFLVEEAEGEGAVPSPGSEPKLRWTVARDERGRPLEAREHEGKELSYRVTYAFSGSGIEGSAVVRDGKGALIAIDEITEGGGAAEGIAIAVRRRGPDGSAIGGRYAAVDARGRLTRLELLIDELPNADPAETRSAAKGETGAAPLAGGPGPAATGRGSEGEAPGSDAAGNRAPGSGAAGNRAPGSGAAGNRAPGSDAAGNRAPGSDAAGNRAPGSDAAGNRAAPPAPGAFLLPPWPGDGPWIWDAAAASGVPLPPFPIPGEAESEKDAIAADFLYDEAGRLARARLLDRDGGLLTEARYSYDGRGRLVEVVVERPKGEGGEKVEGDAAADSVGIVAYRYPPSSPAAWTERRSFAAPTPTLMAGLIGPEALLEPRAWERRRLEAGR